ncbi:hypothetical protein ACFQ07_31755 [Actinomadura adrarensis]|uniref:Uncharacterized protein n=1 Tax=Actinomadura adrarensis TaxID=1819600 RepID=A0ABW3CQL8_9ACTN
MLTMLRKIGLSSNIMYGLGFGSIAASVGVWQLSLKAEPNGIARADRWGIFVGQWAPTFFALGCAMRLEEQWGDHRSIEGTETSRERPRETMPVGG